MTLVAICLVIPQRMHPPGTVMEIWRLKGGHNLDVLESRDVIGLVTI